MTTTSHPLTTTSSRTGSDGKWELPLPPSTIFLAMLAGIFILTALVHPSEAYCLLHGVWFLLCLPSSSILMMIYSICNITERSWGTLNDLRATIGLSMAMGTWEDFMECSEFSGRPTCRLAT